MDIIIIIIEIMITFTGIIINIIIIPIITTMIIFFYQYVDSLVSELDLLIIGAYYGSGRRKGVLSHFLLGVAVPSNEVGKWSVMCFIDFSLICKWKDRT